MKTYIDRPPSVNSRLPYTLDVEIPPGKYYRVDVVVTPGGDLDNRIRPILNALAAKGLSESRVVYISARFGSKNSVRVTSYDF